MKPFILALVLALSGPFLLGESVDILWDAYPDPGLIDGLEVEHSTNISDPNAWLSVSILLAPTETTFTHDVGPGLHHWRVVAVVGSTRTDTNKGVWKRVDPVQPGGARTP